MLPVIFVLQTGSGQQCGSHPSPRATTGTGLSLSTNGNGPPPPRSSFSHCVTEKNNGRLSYPGRGQGIWSYSGGKEGITRSVDLVPNATKGPMALEGDGWAYKVEAII